MATAIDAPAKEWYQLDWQTTEDRRTERIFSSSPADAHIAYDRVESSPGTLWCALSVDGDYRIGYRVLASRGSAVVPFPDRVRRPKQCECGEDIAANEKWCSASCHRADEPGE